MIYLNRLVVILLLAVWSFPATGLAFGENPRSAAGRTPASAVVAETAAGRSAAGGSAATASETRQYAEREKQARNLEQFDGGNVSIYIGGGVLTVVLLIVLILVLL
jgi:hypothetical protein